MTQDQALYPWMAYVKLFTNCTEQELNYFLYQALWRRDDAGVMDKTNLKGIIKNKGFSDRAGEIAKSKTTSLLGKVLTDFSINRLIPDQTEISIRFHRSAVPLCLMAKEGDFKIEIQSAELIVPRITLTSKGLSLAHNMLKGRGLSYPSTRLTMRTKVVSKNDQNCEWVPFSGKLPKRIFVFQLAQSAFNGTIDKNPFNFQHFNLSQICVMKNESCLPLTMAIPFDRKNPDISYLTTLRAINDPSKVHFNSWDYVNGYLLMCFDLTSDSSASTPEYRDECQQGTLRIKLDYSEPLAETITIMCMAEFDDTLKLDGNRNVSWK